VKGSGSKLLLVGDAAQLHSVDAGGAFGMLVEDRADPPQLQKVQRFTCAWEKTASLHLRHGDTAAIDTYAQQDRIPGGAADEMVDAAFLAWRRDRTDGKVSILIADTGDAVTELNRRARADLVRTGPIDSTREVALRDGTAASIGDVVITRRNDRRLRAGSDWVRNGARWTITAIRADGSLTVRRQGRRWAALSYCRPTTWPIISRSVTPSLHTALRD
jgi:ATP-dependent exoDNAse (exonuclease V) alpha subunit